MRKGDVVAVILPNCLEYPLLIQVVDRFSFTDDEIIAPKNAKVIARIISFSCMSSVSSVPFLRAFLLSFKIFRLT